jgi:hypothetical protein
MNGGQSSGPEAPVPTENAALNAWLNIASAAIGMLHAQTTW